MHINVEICHAWPLLQELSPFAEIMFSKLFSVVFWILTWNMEYGFVFTFHRSVQLLSRLRYFHLTYRSLLKFSFTNFSVLRYKIMTLFLWMNLYRYNTDQVQLLGPFDMCL